MATTPAASMVIPIFSITSLNTISHSVSHSARSSILNQPPARPSPDPLDANYWRSGRSGRSGTSGQVVRGVQARRSGPVRLLHLGAALRWLDAQDRAKRRTDDGFLSTAKA